MNFLIEDYSSIYSTEAKYLSKCLGKLEGSDSFLWNQSTVSVFDMFDKVKPDVFLTHYQNLSTDVIKYLRQSKHPITVVLNITGATQEQAEQLKGVLEGIDCPFVFTNNPSDVYTTHGFKVENILNCSDSFLNDKPQLEYSIKNLVMLNQTR